MSSSSRSTGGSLRHTDRGLSLSLRGYIRRLVRRLLLRLRLRLGGSRLLLLLLLLLRLLLLLGGLLLLRLGDGRGRRSAAGGCCRVLGLRHGRQEKFLVLLGISGERLGTGSSATCRDSRQPRKTEDQPEDVRR